jgi:hypothetical protein
VRECKVADIDPQESTSLGNLFLGLALVDVSDALVAGVQGVERVQVVNDGTEHKRGVDGRDGEIRLLLLDKVPRGLLGECLASTVTCSRVLKSLFLSDGVPVGLGVLVARPVALAGVDDRGKTGCDDDTLDRWCTLLDRVQNTGGSDNSRVEKFLLLSQ